MIFCTSASAFREILAATRWEHPGRLRLLELPASQTSLRRPDRHSARTRAFNAGTTSASIPSIFACADQQLSATTPLEAAAQQPLRTQLSDIRPDHLPDCPGRLCRAVLCARSRNKHNFGYYTDPDARD